MGWEGRRLVAQRTPDAQKPEMKTRNMNAKKVRTGTA